MLQEQKNTKPRVPKKSVHLDFTPEEYEAILQKADSVGLTVTAFVRKQALEGKVKGYNMKPLADHAIKLGEVLNAIQSITRDPHRDRWMYEADLELIGDLTRALLEEEKALHEKMARRLKR